jgi:hypothetical protein
MKYDGGYLDAHTRWVKMDGRNKMCQHYTHRITVRSFREIGKLHYYIVNNFENCSSNLYESSPPMILYQRESHGRANFYLNEDDLVKLIIGYVE